MLILAPMHPVMLVYEIDQTEGAELPEELKNFARFEGDWDSKLLSRMIANAAGYHIRVDVKTLSSTNGGFATVARGTGDEKMGPSGISVGRPLSPAPPTKAVLPFVSTSHRSPALASDRWLAPTKAENPAFCTNAFDQCRRAARLIQACLSLECRASAVQFSATGPTRNPDGRKKSLRLIKQSPGSLDLPARDTGWR